MEAKNTDQEEEKQPVGKKFECIICLKTFTTKSNLERHYKGVHENRAKKYIKHEMVDGKLLCKIC